MSRQKTVSAPELYRYAQRLEAAGDFRDDQWTQKALARNAAGQGTAISQDPVNPAKPGPAVRYCAMGHLYRICTTPQEETDIPALTALLSNQLLDNGADASVPDWNDAPGRTPQEVRDLFQQTAAGLYREAVSMIPKDPTATNLEQPAGRPKPAKTGRHQTISS